MRIPLHSSFLDRKGLGVAHSALLRCPWDLREHVRGQFRGHRGHRGFKSGFCWPAKHQSPLSHEWERIPMHGAHSIPSCFSRDKSATSRRTRVFSRSKFFIRRG